MGKRVRSRSALNVEPGREMWRTRGGWRVLPERLERKGLGLSGVMKEG